MLLTIVLSSLLSSFLHCIVLSQFLCLFFLSLSHFFVYYLFLFSFAFCFHVSLIVLVCQSVCLFVRLSVVLVMLPCSSFFLLNHLYSLPWTVWPCCPYNKGCQKEFSLFFIHYHLHALDVQSQTHSTMQHLLFVLLKLCSGLGYTEFAEGWAKGSRQKKSFLVVRPLRPFLIFF